MTELIEFFTKAEELVRRNGFGWEIDWCDRRPPFEVIDEQRFLHEYAWVVFNSGMRNKVIRAKWNDLRKAFRYFIPLQIHSNHSQVRINALKVFGNKRKVEAVISVAEKLVEEGFERTITAKIQQKPLEYLQTLPFIGNVTKYHLARNLGFDFIKPDRHLKRLAAKFGMSPFELCDLIHQKTKRRLGTIDVILWRYCEQRGQTQLVHCKEG